MRDATQPDDGGRAYQLAGPLVQQVAKKASCPARGKHWDEAVSLAE